MSNIGKPIEIKNNFKKINKIIKGYLYIDISTEKDVEKNDNIFQNIKESKFLMINQYIEQNENEKDNPHTYILIGFKKTIINIEKSNFGILQPLLSFNPNINICFLSRIKDINITNNIINTDNNFYTEIDNFNQVLLLNNSCDQKIKNNWKFIKPCISGYLIKESYEKTKINRLDNLINFETQKETKPENNSSKNLPIIKEDEFIELRNIGIGYGFKVTLIYYIESEELCAQKEQNCNKEEIKELSDREIQNYSKVQHPLIPKFIGVGPNKKYLIIEFINGRTLLEINELQLNFIEKITIFAELLIIFEFLHRKEFIYRDLKPNNIIIDENKTAVLIDFDRMIKQENSISTTTNDFFSPYCAPEVNEINFSYECDIYSLGHVFLYIMNPNMKYEQRLNEISKSNRFKGIIEVITNSINEESKGRPSILKMISEFYYSYFKNIQINNLFLINYLKNLTYYYYKYIETEENKIIHYYSLAANQNDAAAQFNLGFLYEKGELIPRDMNKSIHYYSLAANQNHAAAQFNLGLLYEKGELISRDMNKSIHYYSLAANQNDEAAQYNLGFLYEKGKLISRDMNKSIHYYSLAANQNDADAQFNLGLLYEKGELIPRDMNKSIHYYSLAANQNDAKAQFNLGLLYEKGELIPRDMNKSIHYYSLAANQNDAKAQFNLGLLYEKGELIPRDMNKSIHYYSLAANQNDAKAQFNLGFLYEKGELIPRDMNKSIHYYSLAANQNYAAAQFNLGLLYEKGELIPRDMNKSIHYYSLSAHQNYAAAQFSLALIYLSRKYVKKAIDYLTLAAYQDNKNSLFYLALFNLTGLYVKKNPYNGIEYLNQCLGIGSANFVYSNFLVGYFHHVGLYVKRDIKKAIKYYKESSSFNFPLAKNNLGIIYKHGIEKEIKKELGWAIEYFKEAIEHGNCVLSMYNLAHLYFYEQPIENSNLESIKLLLKLSNQNFYQSKFLLCIVSIYEFGNEIDNIILELNKIELISSQLTRSIHHIINYNSLNQTTILKKKYDEYRYIDFIFDFDLFFSEFSKGIDILENGIQIKDETPKEENHRENINSDFYEGFGI